MKNQVKFFLLASIVVIAAACSSGGSKTEASAAKEVKSESFDQALTANTSESVIMWEGYKPTGTHNGTIQISNGTLQLSDGKLSGGEITIDMSSIIVEDIEDPDKNAKLLGHLKSADFFEVETYPTAQFVVTEVKPIDGNQIDKSKEKGDIVPNHAITGNLTMKNITKSITFNALIKMNENSITAETNQFFIDRAQWNVQYGSKSFFNDLKDNFINDEIGLTIKMVIDKDKNLASK